MNPNEISLKNTKAEILEALNAALKKQEKSNAAKSDYVAIEKAKEEKTIVESAKESVKMKIFSDELIKKFNDLERAVQIEEEKLSELYSVEKELQRVTLIINAGKDAIAKVEEDKSIKTDDMNKAIQALKDSYDQKNAELKSAYDTKALAFKTEQTRETEEYAYNLKRTRAKENDDWNDAKTRREAELSEKEKHANELLFEAERKAGYIAELEKKVENISAIVDEAVKNAVDQSTKELEKDYSHKAAIAEKDASNTISQLEYKITVLSKEIEKSNKLADSLQNKLDKAYSEIRDLAAKTVETSGGLKILSSFGGEKS